MARIRTIKPEFWSHPIIARLDDSARLAAIGLLTFADDEGYFLASPAMIRSNLWPLDEDSSKARRVLADLSHAGYIVVREHPTHGAIGWIPTFTKHQRVDRPSPSKLKAYYIDEDSSNARRSFVAVSGIRDQGSGIRDQGANPRTLDDDTTTRTDGSDPERNDDAEPATDPQDSVPAPRDPIPFRPPRGGIVEIDPDDPVGTPSTITPSPIPIRVSFLDWMSYGRPKVSWRPDDRDLWAALWRSYDDASNRVEIFDEMYAALVPTLTNDRFKIWASTAQEWLSQNYPIPEDCRHALVR